MWIQSCAPAKSQPDSITSLYCYVHAHGETLKLQECMLTISDPEAGCRPGPGLVSCYWPALLAHLQLAPPAGHLHASGSTPITDLHCHVHTHGRPCSQGSACQQPGPSQLLVCSQFVLAFAAGPGPPLHVCLR